MKMTVGPSYLKHVRLTGEQLARDIWSSHPNAYAFYHHSLQVMLTTLGKLEARALRLGIIPRKPLGYRLCILSETRWSHVSCSCCCFLPNEWITR